MGISVACMMRKVAAQIFCDFGQLLLCLCPFTQQSPLTDGLLERIRRYRFAPAYISALGSGSSRA
jgi:hypothetical protein